MNLFLRIAGKDELQSSYFQRTEVTIHVTILYRHALPEVDGIDSTEESPNIVTEQFIVFSNDEKHDHHFVHKYVSLHYINTIIMLAYFKQMQNNTNIRHYLKTSLTFQIIEKLHFDLHI